MKKIICLIFFIPSIFYSQDWITPVIDGYGKIKYSKNIAVQPDENLHYKAVYKITSSEKREGINKGLNGIAHAINMLGCKNIKKENVDIVATIQGQATTVVLSDDAYEKKFGTKNPNDVQVTLRKIQKTKAFQEYISSRGKVDYIQSYITNTVKRFQ